MNTKFLALLLLFLLNVGHLSAQTLFDKIEFWAADHRFELSHGAQFAQYVNSNIHFVQEKYDRDVIFHDAVAEDKLEFDNFLSGEIGASQFKLAFGIELSQRYQAEFSVTHLTYIVDVERDYYQLGYWDGQAVNGLIRMDQSIRKLEHSNGVNQWYIGIKRKFSLLGKADSKLRLQASVGPNLGLLISATQAFILNPDGEVEEFEPLNNISGHGGGLEAVLVLSLNDRWLLRGNYQYFGMMLRQARIESGSYVSHRIRGDNYGIALGFRVGKPKAQ